MDVQPAALVPLELSEIHPSGWLRRQLAIQAAGLSGHLDEFWPDIQRSGWIGGDREGWERAPYWLDGFVPLAALLEDDRLEAKVRRWFDYILSHQHEDGWLGPRELGTVSNVEARQGDPWPICLVLKAMLQYYSRYGDPRTLPAMLKAIRAVDREINTRPLSSWAAFRSHELIIPLLWLAERDGEHADELLWIARRMTRQGYNWIDHFHEMPYRQRCGAVTVREGQGTAVRSSWAYDNHVVNHAMAIRVPALRHRLGLLADGLAETRLFIEQLDRYHGQVTGMFSGDESLAGRMPSQGVELCAVVEYLYSLEQALSAFGEAEFADRLERIAFNALPATFSPDMWTHQYVQQPNQVFCGHVGTDDPTTRIYTNNSARANCFGLEPNFGCCTANMHQGWPKFAAHLWMRVAGGEGGGKGADGLAAVAWAPCRLDTHLGGARATVDVVTDYPFRSDIEIHLTVDRPAQAELRLRIPGWARGAKVTVDGESERGVPAGAFHVLRRQWSGHHRIRLRFPMPTVTERRFNNSVSIHRGPLVYSLKIGDAWEPLPPLPWQADRQEILDHPDFEVRATSPWNYALEMDEGDVDSGVTFEERPVGPCPFSPEGAPVVGRVRGRRVAGWDLDRGAAAAPPASPVAATEPLGPSEPLTLIPYGCTTLRVSEFPTVGKPAGEG